MMDYRDVIIRPIITEKSMKLMAEDNKVTFEVAKGVNKIEVRQAVEALFHVDVVSVNIMNVKPKDTSCWTLRWKNEPCPQSDCKNQRRPDNRLVW